MTWIILQISNKFFYQKDLLYRIGDEHAISHWLKDEVEGIGQINKPSQNWNLEISLAILKNDTWSCKHYQNDNWLMETSIEL